MKHTKIMGRIVLLFVIVMLMSFIPENFREFFGDWECQGSQYNPSDHTHTGCNYIGNGYGSHMATWHWGFRHWIWMCMGVVLFFYNAILIVEPSDEEIVSEVSKLKFSKDGYWIITTDHYYDETFEEDAREQK